jgi:hypothetical protein
MTPLKKCQYPTNNQKIQFWEQLVPYKIRAKSKFILNLGAILQVQNKFGVTISHVFSTKIEGGGTIVLS